MSKSRFWLALLVAAALSAPVHADLPKEAAKDLKNVASGARKKHQKTLKDLLAAALKSAKTIKKQSKGKSADLDALSDQLGESLANYFDRSDATLEEALREIAGAVFHIALFVDTDGCEGVGSGGIGETEAYRLKKISDKSGCKVAAVYRSTAARIAGKGGPRIGIAIFPAAGNHQLTPDEDAATSDDTIRPGIHFAVGNTKCLRIGGILKVEEDGEGTVAVADELPLAGEFVSLNSDGSVVTPPGLPPGAELTTSVTDAGGGNTYVRFVVKLTDQSLSGAEGSTVRVIADSDVDGENLRDTRLFKLH